MGIFRSYLQDRRQIVEIRDEFSHVIRFDIGVTQESVLGIVLCVVLMNDLSSNLSYYTTMFADDTSFLCSHKDIKQLCNTADTSLNEAVLWLQIMDFI